MTQAQTHGWRQINSITSSCVSPLLFSFTFSLSSLHILSSAATPFPLDPSFLSLPAHPKRPPITLATSAPPVLHSKTPSPTSSVSSLLPSLFLSSDLKPLDIALIPKTFPLFEFTTILSSNFSILFRNKRSGSSSEAGGV